MKNTLIYSGLIILLLVTINQFPANAKTVLDIPVEVTDVREIGISANDRSKTIIEVRWRVNPTLNAGVSSYKLTLSVTYADGTIFSESKRAEAKANSIRFEVPNTNNSKSGTPANIKKMNAVVLAVITEKTTYLKSNAVVPTAVSGASRVRV